MRGFFGGLLIGLVTVVIAIVALSLLSPASQAPNVTDGAPIAATGPADNRDEAGDPGGVSDGADADLAGSAPTAPTAQQAPGDTLKPLDEADIKPADKPSVGDATAGLADPGAVARVPGLAPNADASVTPSSPGNTLSSPQGETQPRALADPAQPVVGDGTVGGAGFGTGAGGAGAGSGAQTGAALPELGTGTDPAPALAGGGLVAQAPGTEESPDPSTTSATPPATTPATPAVPATPITPATPAAPTALTTPTTPITPATPSASLPQSGVAPVPQVDPDAPAEPPQPADTSPQPGRQIAALPQAGTQVGIQAGTTPDDQGPRIGKRVIPLTERRQAGASDTQADPATSPDTPPDPAAADGPWIETNAEAFDNPENRPVMAIVLIDDGQGLGVEMLAEFPYPLTFAIDPSAPDAAARMARHRAAGFEVVALIDLPTAANAQDAEVSLSVWLDTMPQVVALLEGTGTGIQGNRELSDQVTTIAGDTGLGLVMQSRGLNTAQKLAARAGVPSALVFRDFDGAGQTPVVIRRFLDQAAFRAGQQGGVIMLGRIRPDTISALLLWGLQDRASRLALAPVSAVLMRQASGQ